MSKKTKGAKINPNVTLKNVRKADSTAYYPISIG